MTNIYEIKLRKIGTKNDANSQNKIEGKSRKIIKNNDKNRRNEIAKNLEK